MLSSLPSLLPSLKCSLWWKYCFFSFYLSVSVFIIEVILILSGVQNIVISKWSILISPEMLQDCSNQSQGVSAWNKGAFWYWSISRTVIGTSVGSEQSVLNLKQQFWVQTREVSKAKQFKWITYVILSFAMRWRNLTLLLEQIRGVTCVGTFTISLVFYLQVKTIY